MKKLHDNKDSNAKANGKDVLFVAPKAPSYDQMFKDSVIRIDMGGFQQDLRPEKDKIAQGIVR